MPKQPPVGRMSERSIRSTLNTIKKGMRDPAIKPTQLLKLLDHQARLQNELRIVTAETIKRKLEALDAEQQWMAAIMPARLAD